MEPYKRGARIKDPTRFRDACEGTTPEENDAYCKEALRNSCLAILVPLAIYTVAVLVLIAYLRTFPLAL